jgi:hypothetical protein
MPLEWIRCAKSKVRVVFPAPPTVAFPQQITGTGGFHPTSEIRPATILAKTLDNGVKARASPVDLSQKEGARIICNLQLVSRPSP